MPNFAKILFSGHILVKPLWNRFKPTKAVNNKKYLLTNIGLASTPNDRDISTKVPATIRIMRSAFMM